MISSVNVEWQPCDPEMPAKAKPVVLSQVGYSIGVLSILHATPNHGV